MIHLRIMYFYWWEDGSGKIINRTLLQGPVQKWSIRPWLQPLVDHFGLNNWSLVKEPKSGEAIQMILICVNQVMSCILLQIWCSEWGLSTSRYFHSHFIKEKILSQDIVNFINSKINWLISSHSVWGILKLIST